MAKRVLVYREDGQQEIVDLEGKNELQELQGIVGGYIEGYVLGDGVMLICNEEGKFTKGPNPCGIGWVPGDHIFGAFCITRNNDEGDMVDLTDSDIADYSRIGAN